MIENQLAPVPAGKGGRHAGKDRQHQPVGQDGLRPVQPETGIAARNGQQHHGRDGVVPAGNADADAGHNQEFQGSDDGRQHAEAEGGAGRPLADLDPEGLARPPVEDVDAKRGDDEGDGEVHQHGVDRVTRYGNCRTDVFFRHGANGRIGMVAAGFRTLLEFHLLRFALADLFAHRPVTRLKPAAFVVTPLLLAGCAGELSTLDPAGPRAASLSTLWWIMLAGSAALFGLVIVLFVLTYVRTGWLARVTPGQWIVGGGLLLPLPVLVLLTGTALVLGEQLLPSGEAPVRVGAHAQRWHWTFTYPDGTTVPDETLHLPAGRPVDVVVTAEDVIHSFWIPRLGGKIDAIPGHPNVIRLEADKPGIYWGQCAEYCGEGHDGMLFRVEAHTVEDFAALTEGGPD